MLPFIKIPFLDAPPIPPKKLSGTETTRAQGQDTTKKDNALYPQVARSLCNIAVGITNINIAKIINDIRNKTSPDNPRLDMNVEVKKEGVISIYKLQMMSLWSEEDEARYLGVVGRIIPVG